jgi:hypothetical protein
LHLHPRVDLPDGSCTRVPEGGDGGDDRDIRYVAIEQDLDQSPEEPKANLASEGKPGSLTLSFLKLCNYFPMIVHSRSGVELKP